MCRLQKTPRPGRRNAGRPLERAFFTITVNLVAHAGRLSTFTYSFRNSRKPGEAEACLEEAPALVEHGLLDDLVRPHQH